MEFKRSPYHYWYKYPNPDYVSEPATPTQIYGNAFYTFILEHNKFKQDFFVLPKFDKRTKADAERWVQLQTELGNKTILTEIQHQELQAMAASIHKNTLAMQLIEHVQIEQSLYWNDPDTSILCKCRPDILRSTLVADLKTTQAGSAWSFSKAIYDYGYHIQAAMIKEGLQQLVKTAINDFFFIVIEKSAPYATLIYQLDQASLNKGNEAFKTLLSCYQQCLEANNWPGYQTQEISLPCYAFN